MDAFAAAVGSLRAGDYTAALAQLDEILKNQPDSAPALAYAGIARLLLKDVAGAQHLLDRAVAADPADFIAWAKRGELWFRLACFPQAVADLRRALSLEAPSPASRRWAARMLESAEQRARLSYTRTLALPRLRVDRLPDPLSRPGAPWSGTISALFRRLAPPHLSAHPAAPHPEPASA